MNRLGGGWSAPAQYYIVLVVFKQEPLVRFEAEPWGDDYSFSFVHWVGAKLNRPKITDHLSQGKKSKELTNQDLHPALEFRLRPRFNSMPGKLPIYSELAMV
jgi:hypothetical protein